MKCITLKCALLFVRLHWRYNIINLENVFIQKCRKVFPVIQVLMNWKNSLLIKERYSLIKFVICFVSLVIVFKYSFSAFVSILLHDDWYTYLLYSVQRLFEVELHVVMFLNMNNTWWLGYCLATCNSRTCDV